MILEKRTLSFPDDPTPPEAPPAYEDEGKYVPFEKSAATGAAQPVASSSSSRSTPSSSKYVLPPISASRNPSKGKKSRWFSFGQQSPPPPPPAALQVKQTILNLLREVVQVTAIHDALLILRNCQNACQSHGLDFSSVLQERSLEEHSSLYWAIIKHPSKQDVPAYDLVETLLSLASPLTSTTISEVRLACLQNSDQRLFQRLRRTAAFAPLTGSDEMLLGVDVPPDEVAVEDVPGDEGAFAVTLRFILFQKRMRISKQVNVEFIARGRMWRLQFLEAEINGSSGHSAVEKGAWFIRLSLMEHSPPTYLDSHLLISDARPPTPPSPSSPASPVPSDATVSLSGRLFSSQNKDPNKPKPNIELRLKTSSSIQLAPPPQIRGSVDSHSFVYALEASLNKSLMGNSLQFDGSSYIASDGSLSARLEAKLAKPDAECIIC